MIENIGINEKGLLTKLIERDRQSKPHLANLTKKQKRMTSAELYC